MNIIKKFKNCKSVNKIMTNYVKSPKNIYANYSIKKRYNDNLKPYDFKLYDTKCVTTKHTDFIINHDDYKNMAERQKEEEEFIKKLESDGHTCIMILESYPIQVRHCNRDTCVNIIR